MKKCKFVFVKLLIPLLLIIIIPLIPKFLFNQEMLLLLIEYIIRNDVGMEFIMEVTQRTNYTIIFFFYIIWIPLILNYYKNRNKDLLFNSNGNIYYDLPYCFFWIASNVLGYGTVQLAGIPISMHYKLVLKNTFPNIIGDFNNNHYSETEKEANNRRGLVSIQHCNNQSQTNSLNIIISDTYDIHQNSIGKKYSNNKIVKIKSNLNGTGIRYRNKKLVEKVRETVNEYYDSPKYENIYVFSTANPVNNIDIINSSFRLFGKDIGKTVRIIEWNNDEKVYNKETKIF